MTPVHSWMLLLLTASCWLIKYQAQRLR